MTNIITGIICFIAGGCFGVIVMALVSTNRDDSDKEKYQEIIDIIDSECPSNIGLKDCEYCNCTCQECWKKAFNCELKERQLLSWGSDDE